MGIDKPEKGPHGVLVSTVSPAVTTNTGNAAVQILERFDTNSYFTSMLAGQDGTSPSTKSLYERLSNMDELLGDSTNFSNTTILEVISRMKSENERIKYIEGLILRLALTLQSLNQSMGNFIKGSGTHEIREIGIISKKGQASKIYPRLNPNAKKSLAIVIADSPVSEERAMQPLYRQVFPIHFQDDTFGIRKDSKLAISLGDNNQMCGVLPLKFTNHEWRSSRYLRITNCEMSPSKPFHCSLLYINEQILGIINDGAITTDIYDQIFQRIQALCLQMGDVGDLLNQAKEVFSQRESPKLPDIKF